jgi:glutamyl-tRNA synthetase
MPGLKERAKTLVELIESARYLYADRPIALDEKAEGLITPEARTLLGSLARDFAAIEPWTAAAAEAAVRAYADRAGMKLGAVAQPLRAALTGRTTSPGIFEVLAVLGKTESLARIGDQAVAQA